MREVTYYVAISLDGRIAAPDGDWSAFPQEGDHLEAIFRDYADALPSHVLSELGRTPDRSRFDTVMMGWNTYTPALAVGIDSPYKHLRQVVASRQARMVPETVEITADPGQRLRELRQEPGSGIWLAGGGTLAGALLDQIGRLVLKINPLVFGSGVPLFGGQEYAPTAFERVAYTPFASGVVIAEYQRVAP